MTDLCPLSYFTTPLDNMGIIESKIWFIIIELKGLIQGQPGRTLDTQLPFDVIHSHAHIQ